MMTLRQMAVFITGKVGQFDDVAMSLCKGYIAARYRMVWDNYFWRDTQMSASATLLKGGNTIPFPTGMERVVTIRAIGNPPTLSGGGGGGGSSLGPIGGNDDQPAPVPVSVASDVFLDPVDESFLLETDFNMFSLAGRPQFYSEILTGVSADGAANGNLRIYPPVEFDTRFYIFGKRACPNLTSDNGVSILRNCDNAIIAFAMGDMLERLRQFAKAQAKFQEAKELLEEAKSVERDQANKPRRNKNLTVKGNSLAEMVDAVCGICGSWTPDIRILVKEFLRRNYVALYEMMLWPESTVVVRVTHVGEQVILPHYVDRAVSARSSNGSRLMPNEVNYLFGVSPTIFENTGTPVSMSTLTPVGVAVLPLQPPEALLIGSSEPQDAGRRVFISGESNGTETSEEVILNNPATSPVATRYAYDVPLSVSKEITLGNVAINGARTSVLYQWLPAEERERKHQRVWLLPSPSAASLHQTLILGKRKINPLRTEEDTPMIAGAQGVLIAAAAADLFPRLGNNDSATLYRTRADASAKVLVSSNTDQSAYSPKIVPLIEPLALGIGESQCWSKE